MRFIGFICLVGFIPVAGAFYKWAVHVLHTWMPLVVPEIPYGTACMAVFVVVCSAIALLLLALGATQLWKD